MDNINLAVTHQNTSNGLLEEVENDIVDLEQFTTDKYQLQ